MFRIHDYFYRCFQGGRNGGSMTDHPVEIIGRNSETLPLHPCDGDIRGGNPTHIFMNIKTLEGNIVSYTGCFTTCGHYCTRWLPRSLWSKKFIWTYVRFWTVTELWAFFNSRTRPRVNPVLRNQLAVDVLSLVAYRLRKLQLATRTVHNRAAACVAAGGGIFENQL